MMKRPLLLILSIICLCVANASEPFSEFMLSRARSGNLTAQYDLGVAYIEGNGVAKNVKEGQYWLEKCASKGHAAAQGYLGDIYYYIHHDPKQACHWWQKASDGGDLDMTFNLSIMYRDGNGVPKDMAKSVSLLRKGAEAGHAVSMFNLANYYTRGDGVPRDERTALSWYTKAADKGHPGAMYNLCLSYANGYGTARNMARAGEYLRRAAEAGYPYALFEAARQYYDGGTMVSGVKDFNKAFTYMTRFVDAGKTMQIENELYGEAYKLLSKCYRFGR